MRTTGPLSKSTITLVVRSRRSCEEKRTLDRQRGALLLEYILAAGVALVLLATFMVHQSFIVQEQKDTAAADQLNAIVAAAAQYMETESTALSSDTVLTPSQPIAIPVANTVSTTYSTGPGGVPTIQAAGYLSPSFTDGDPYGQTHYLIVRETSSGGLYGMIASVGGRAIPTFDLGLITSKTNGAGAIITNAVEKGTSEFAFVGGGNLWFESVSDYVPASGISSLSAGHYGATLNFNTSPSGLSQYLDRYSVSGNIDASTMHTDLNMGGNSITDSDAIFFENGNTVGDDGAGGTTFAGNTVNSGSTQSGAGNYVAGNATTGTDVAEQNSSVGGSEDAVSGLAVNAETLSPLGTAGDACSPVGAMVSSTDGQGVILACVASGNGDIWEALDGSVQGFTHYMNLGCSSANQVEPDEFELAWNNTLPTPVAIYETAQENFGAGHSVNYTYDQYGNEVDEDDYFTGQGGSSNAYQEVPSIIPPYGSVQLFSEETTVCAYIRY
jgi:hypothetical protein